MHHLDRAVRLLAAAPEDPEVRLRLAVLLVDYHVRRNKVAKASHDRVWKRKRGKVGFLLL